MIQEFIDRHFYHLFLITLFFGVVLYGLIGFQSIDELCGALLFLMFLFHMFNTKDWEINKFFMIVLKDVSCFRLVTRCLGDGLWHL